MCMHIDTSFPEEQVPQINQPHKRTYNLIYNVSYQKQRLWQTLTVSSHSHPSFPKPRLFMFLKLFHKRAMVMGSLTSNKSILQIRPRDPCSSWSLCRHWPSLTCLLGHHQILHRLVLWHSPRFQLTIPQKLCPQYCHWCSPLAHHEAASQVPWMGEAAQATFYVLANSLKVWKVNWHIWTPFDHTISFWVSDICASVGDVECVFL